MGIVTATKSFVHTSAGSRLEVVEGSQFSEHAEVVEANKRSFAKASEDDVRKAVEKARPESDRR